MRIWVRADASCQIGLGHVMRTLAVAQAAEAAGYSVEYLLRNLDVTPSLLGRFDVAWRPYLPELIRRGDVVIFDGYDFTLDDQSQAVDVGARVVIIDDFGVGAFPAADIVVNPNTTLCTYDLTSGAQLLAGPRYALVRREFGHFRRPRGTLGTPLLVTLGGSDATGLAPLVFNVVGLLAPLDRQVVFVAGPTSATPASAPRPGVEIVHSPLDVGATFDRADLAIAAAGATTWELLCMGMPSVFLQAVENQATICATVEACGAGIVVKDPRDVECVSAAFHELTSQRRRSELSAIGRELVDGLGATRLVQSLA